MATARKLYPAIPVEAPPQAPQYVPQADEWRFQTAQLHISRLDAIADDHKKRERKFRRTVRILSAVGTGSGTIGVATGITGASLSATGVGLAVGAPLAGAGAGLSAVSVALALSVKRYMALVAKHETLWRIARDSSAQIQGLLSKAFADGMLDVAEFQAIEEVYRDFYRQQETISSETDSRLKDLRDNRVEDGLEEIKRYLSLRRKKT